MRVFDTNNYYIQRMHFVKHLFSLLCFALVIHMVPAQNCVINSNRCFAIVSNQRLDWLPAENYCAANFNNGHLASIRNGFEKNLISSLIGSNPVASDLWIGGYRTNESPYQWYDGAPFTYTNFAPGQPQKDGFCIQICVVSQSCRPGEWKAVPCVQFSSLFVCEFEQTSTAFSTTAYASSSQSATFSPFQTTPGFCTPPTAPPNVYPCQANILISLDGSGGLTYQQFAQQKAFISNQLIATNWTFEQLAILEFDNGVEDLLILSSFDNLHSYNELQAVLQSTYRLGDIPPSITSALQQATTLSQIYGAQPCIKQTTILFTSTSAASDVANATPFATILKQRGGNLIIIGMGNTVDNNALTALASPSSYFPWPDYDNVPVNLASSIIQSFHC